MTDDEYACDLYDDLDHADETVTCETCAPCGCDIMDDGPDPRDSVVLHDHHCGSRRKETA